MKDIVYTINQFKETIIVHTIVAILVIAISTVMLCIWRKNHVWRAVSYSRHGGLWYCY